MSLMTFLTWMDNLPSSIALRESTWTYPSSNQSIPSGFACSWG
jgi:hypothetical protein